MPRFRLRRLLMVVVSLVALVWLLPRIATLILPQDRLRERIAREVATATGGELEPGRVTVKLVGGLGVALRDGRLRGTGAAWYQRTGQGGNVGAYDVAFAKLDLSFGLWSLLQRRVEISRARLQGDTALIEIDGDPLRLRAFEIQLTGLRLDLPPASAAAGGAPADRIPTDLKFDLKARAAELVQRGTAWQQVDLSGSWAQKRLEIASLTGTLAEGRVTATGTLDFSSDPWGRLDWQARLANLPAGPLLTPYLPDLGHRLECALDGDLAGAMELRDQRTRRQSLTVSGQLQAGEGVLRAADWLRDVSPYLGPRQDLKTVRFSRLSHRFRVEQGRYVTEMLEIDGHETDWQADGWLGFEGGIGLNVGVRLPEGFTPDLGGMSFLAETLRDPEGRVNLGLKLSGRAAAPTIGLDFSRLGAKR